MESLSADAFAITQRARSRQAQIQDSLNDTIFLNRSYRKLFFDSNGNLKPEARAVLNDLVAESGIGLASPSLGHAELAAKEGRRRMVLHIFGRFRLPANRIDNLEKFLTKEDE